MLLVSQEGEKTVDQAPRGLVGGAGAFGEKKTQGDVVFTSYLWEAVAESMWSQGTELGLMGKYYKKGEFVFSRRRNFLTFWATQTGAGCPKRNEDSVPGDLQVEAR